MGTPSETDLIEINGQKLTALKVFDNGGAAKLIEDIEVEARRFVPDISTSKSRKEIASLAYKIARSKTALDKLGKDLVSDWKVKAKAVDLERKLIRDRLDALALEIRRPLTEWEESESRRIEEEKLSAEINRCHEEALIEDGLWLRLREVERKEAEQLAIENERKAKEELLRAESERVKKDAAIAKAAADAATKAAADKFAEEKAASEREVALAKAREELSRKEAEDAIRLEKERRVKEVKAAEDKAKQDIINADLLRKEEEMRLIEEAEIQKENELKRIANKNHQRAVNNECVKFLCSFVDEDAAKAIVVGIVKAKLKYLSVNY